MVWFGPAGNQHEAGMYWHVLQYLLDEDLQHHVVHVDGPRLYHQVGIQARNHQCPVAGSRYSHWSHGALDILVLHADAERLQ